MDQDGIGKSIERPHHQSKQLKVFLNHPTIVSHEGGGVQSGSQNFLVKQKTTIDRSMKRSFNGGGVLSDVTD